MAVCCACRRIRLASKANAKISRSVFRFRGALALFSHPSSEEQRTPAPSSLIVTMQSRALAVTIARRWDRKELLPRAVRTTRTILPAAPALPPHRALHSTVGFGLSALGGWGRFCLHRLRQRGRRSLSGVAWPADDGALGHSRSGRSQRLAG